jgi:hypothetical protein
MDWLQQENIELTPAFGPLTIHMVQKVFSLWFPFSLTQLLELAFIQINYMVISGTKDEKLIEAIKLGNNLITGIVLGTSIGMNSAFETLGS